jgi:hypothetical protein
MRRKGLFVPKLHDRNVRKLYHHAHRFSMPVSKLLNLIVATGLEQLDEVNDPDEWETWEPVRLEEEPEDAPASAFINTSRPESRIHNAEPVPHADNSQPADCHIDSRPGACGTAICEPEKCY